jgi:hypothetical protein
MFGVFFCCALIGRQPGLVTESAITNRSGTRKNLRRINSSFDESADELSESTLKASEIA